MSVTLINTQPLPTYSTERFYMLSELEMNAHSTSFLCDLYDCDQTQDTAESSEASLDPQPTIQQQQQQHPSYSILYILWKSDQASSPRAFAEGTVAAAIKQWKSVAVEGSASSLTTTTQDISPTKKDTTEYPRLYLVVDIAASSDETTNNATPTDDDDYDEDSRQRHFQVKADTAERLARNVAQSQEFRRSVAGITVGISNHVRAAPGLEACLDAVTIGARDRRRLSSVAKSSIGLVALHPDDLLGLQDETVTDAAQGVLQSRTCAEWNGNGNLQSFARRAHSAWCISHGVNEESPSRKPKTRRRRRDLDGEFALDVDPLMTCLVVFFFGYVLSHLWITYYAEG